MTSSLEILTGNNLHSEVNKRIPILIDYPLGTCLLVDADRTLCPEDTGRLVGQAFGVNNRIRDIFETLDYHDDAFAAVSSIWSSIPSEAYLREIAIVANNLQIRNSWHEILQKVKDYAPVIVITAGIPQVWRIALSKAGYTKIPVIGGCHRDLDEYVVSAKAKGEIVGVLRQLGWTVIAAGDSCTDLPMLTAANTALFVPDYKGSPSLRSKLNDVPAVRHLIVDAQRFDNIPTCSPIEAAEMVLCKGIWNADRSY